MSGFSHSTSRLSASSVLSPSLHSILWPNTTPPGGRTPSCLSLPQRLHCLGFGLRGVVLLLVGTFACGRTCPFLWAASLHVVLLSVLLPRVLGLLAGQGILPLLPTYGTLHPPPPACIRGAFPRFSGPDPHSPQPHSSRWPVFPPLGWVILLPATNLCSRCVLCPECSCPFPSLLSAGNSHPREMAPHLCFREGPSWRSPSVYLLNSLSPPRLCSYVFIYKRGF